MNRAKQKEHQKAVLKKQNYIETHRRKKTFYKLFRMKVQMRHHPIASTYLVKKKN